jgi:hypothetical protein
MRIRSNSLFFLLLVLFSVPNGLIAQFLGGNGDGIALLALANPDPCPYYYGDTADGHATDFLPNPDSCDYYDGGFADGFATLLLPNPDSCEFYIGSTADGYASFLLPNPDSCGFYEGTTADGFAVGEFLSPIPCPTFYGTTSDGFALGELVCAPLAVTASELEGRVVGNDGYLWWVTYMEVNNLGFSLQRSPDRIEWTEISFLAGQDQSQQVIRYEHLDTEMPMGVSYYRWVQMDLDGSTSRSNIVALVRDESGTSVWFRVFPVPLASGEILRIRFENGRKGALRLRVADLYGRVVREWDVADFEGKLDAEMGTDDLAAGIYVLSVQQEGRVWVKRVVVQ